jgi:hypothetical protein
MKPDRDDLVNQLNIQLEPIIARQKEQEILSDPQQPFSSPEIARTEVMDLARLAHHLQNAPALRVDPAFTEHLERRILERNNLLRALEQETRRGQSRFRAASRGLRHPYLLLATAVFVLLLGGTGVLFVASQTHDPANPLYAMKRWEQEVQREINTTPQDRARISLQIARDQLSTLAYTTNPSYSKKYQQALDELTEELTNATQIIQTLPEGQIRDQLVGDLSRCKTDARQTLRDLLPQLALPEQLVTTRELGWLGDTIPSLQKVEIEMHADVMTLRLHGSYLVADAQLLLDHAPMSTQGTLQDNTLVFVITWSNQQQVPHTLGILNPDGTGTETTAITITTNVTENNGNNSGDGTESTGDNSANTGSNEQGDSNSTPTPTPTPTTGNGDNSESNNTDQGNNQNEDNNSNKNDSQGDNSANTNQKSDIQDIIDSVKQIEKIINSQTGDDDS